MLRKQKNEVFIHSFKTLRSQDKSALKTQSGTALNRFEEKEEEQEDD